MEEVKAWGTRWFGEKQWRLKWKEAERVRKAKEESGEEADSVNTRRVNDHASQKKPSPRKDVGPSLDLPGSIPGGLDW